MVGCGRKFYLKGVSGLLYKLTVSGLFYSAILVLCLDKDFVGRCVCIVNYFFNLVLYLLSVKKVLA